MSYRSIAVATLLVASSITFAGPATRPTTRPANPLEQRLPDVDTAGRTMKQVLTDLSQQTHLKIVADWPRLNAAGVDSARALHGRLMNVRLKETIQYLYGEAGGSGAITIMAKDGELDLTPASAADAEPDTGPPTAVATKTYNIRHLLVLVGARTNRNTPREGLVDQMIKTVQMSVAPETWRDAGGTIGTVEIVGDALVVTQTNENQAKVAKLLKDLESNN